MKNEIQFFAYPYKKIFNSQLNKNFVINII